MAIQQTAQQPFVWGRGGRRLTPEEVERERQIAEALVQGGVDVSPVGHWLQGAARVAQALSGKIREGRANSAAEANAAASSANMSRLYSALGGGGGSVSPVGQQASTTSAMPTAGPVQDVSVPATADAQYIREGLINRGLPEHVADGFLVNFKDESGLNPGINEQNPIVPGSRGGFGLYQLTGPRRVAYEKFAQERGVTPDNVDAQLDFLMTELQGPEKRAAEYIMRAGDTGTAAQAIVNHFLRPAQEHRDRRMAAYANLGGAAPSEAASVEVAQAAPQVMTDAAPMSSAPQAQAQINPIIFETLSNRYASEEEKALANLLLQRQMTEQEAARETAFKQQQEAQELARRQALAGQVGIDPRYAQDPQLWKGATENLFADAPTAVVNGVVVNTRTGQPIYQTPAETYRQVYGEEAAAMGLDPSKAYNIAPNGEVRPIGEGGVVVNNNLGEDQFGGEFAKLDAKALSTVSESGLAAQRNLGRIDQLESLLNESPTGFAAAAAQRAGEWGIPTEGLDQIQAAQAAINSLVPEQRQPGSGPMSDADLALFKQSLPRIINQPGGNQLIINTMRGIAQYDAEGAAIVQRLRNGEISRAQAFQELQSRQNPLASFKAPPAPQENPLPPQTNGRKTSTGATWEILD